MMTGTKEFNKMTLYGARKRWENIELRAINMDDEMYDHETYSYMWIWVSEPIHYYSNGKPNYNKFRLGYMTRKRWGKVCYPQAYFGGVWFTYDKRH
jgi:hypothetical protein